MKEIIKFFTNNSSQIWTLISVLIGGLVTYLSTSATEKRKNKRQAQKENLEQVLVPYYTCLEKTVTTINIAYQNPVELYSQENFMEWIYNLKKPLEYLEVVKRIYLSEAMRQKLQQYKNHIETFECVLAQECTECLRKYIHYIENKVLPFPDLSTSMSIIPSMNELVESKIKIAILNKSELSLIDDFTCIDFVKNDEPENYKHTAVQINNDIREQLGAINLGFLNISDIEDKQVILSCKLLDFIYQNVTDEQETLNGIIDDTQSAKCLSDILDSLDAMRRELEQRIDNIIN